MSCSRGPGPGRVWAGIPGEALWSLVPHVRDPVKRAWVRFGQVMSPPTAWGPAQCFVSQQGGWAWPGVVLHPWSAGVLLALNGFICGQGSEGLWLPGRVSSRLAQASPQVVSGFQKTRREQAFARATFAVVLWPERVRPCSGVTGWMESLSCAAAAAVTRLWAWLAWKELQWGVWRGRFHRMPLACSRTGARPRSPAPGEGEKGLWDGPCVDVQGEVH